MKDLSSSGFNNLWAAVSMLALAIVSVALRFTIRLSARLSFTWSDWLILVAVVMITVYSALMINCKLPWPSLALYDNRSAQAWSHIHVDVVDGVGPGTYDLNEIAANYRNGGQLWGQSLLKMLYVVDLFFGLTITFVKLSILSFYYTIFSISKKFQLWTYIIGFACIVWLIVYLFLNIFQCKPIHALWDDLGSTEYCIPSGKLWLGYELPNFFLDVLVLCLPVAMLRRLQLPRGQKWSVAGIFLLGGLVCVTSMVRMVYIWNPETPQVVRVPNTMVMASVQLGTAILCACLPTYGPLIEPCSRRIHRIKQTIGSSVSAPYSFSQSSRSRGLINKDSANRDLESAPYYRVTGHGSVLQQTQISRGDGESLPLEELPLHSIMVQRSVEVT
ncbi:hypothetical protein F5Y05DRAFT_279533 [Hypoxylon sp. FL0543]|nr:hypothetical protein F5Y05DRAFT_279533 [Hypoxylon sp. FL0543]